MPTENTNEKPLEKGQKTVPLDTSGPGAEVIVSDEKEPKNARVNIVEIPKGNSTTKPKD